jgi:hypothetical protein
MDQRAEKLEAKQQRQPALPSRHLIRHEHEEGQQVTMPSSGDQSCLTKQ